MHSPKVYKKYIRFCANCSFRPPKLREVMDRLVVIHGQPTLAVRKPRKTLISQVTQFRVAHTNTAALADDFSVVRHFPFPTWLTFQRDPGVRGRCQALEKRRYWDRHQRAGLHQRQRKVLQRLLDDGDGGFQGGLNAEKYMKMTRVSKATATRDLSQMRAKRQTWSQGAGKALRYYVNVPGWKHGVGDAV